jgi:hypothetical protein
MSGNHIGFQVIVYVTPYRGEQPYVTAVLPGEIYGTYERAARERDRLSAHDKIDVDAGENPGYAQNFQVAELRTYDPDDR